MAKKLLYIEDLYNFYLKGEKSFHFDADETESPIVVQVKGNLKFDSESKDNEGLLPVHLQACHTGINKKNTNINETAAEAALASFSNRPILAYIHKVNGQYEFYKHNLHKDEDGETVYDEIPVGIIPESCGAKLIYDEDKNKKYVEVDGYIFEEYSKAAEILQREEECSVSVEIYIKSCSYNAKEKYLDIEDFHFNGVTILGKNEYGIKINPGMTGSNIKLSDFSENNNSMFCNFSEELTDIKSKLNELSSFFSNLEEKSGKEDIVKMSTNGKESNVPEKTKKFSFELGGKTKNFEISLEDKISSLYELVNSTYAEADNTFYSVTCYENYLIMHDYWSGRHYKQSYESKEDNYSLTGERVQVYAEFVTKDEQSALETMRADYSSLVEYKEKNETEKTRFEKKKILEDSKYSVLADNEAYNNLVKDMDKYSVNDLKKEVKVIFADYVSAAGHFSIDEDVQSHIGRKTFGEVSKPVRKNRYGNIFNK